MRASTEHANARKLHAWFKTETRKEEEKKRDTAGGGTTTSDAVGPGAPASMDKGNDAARTEAGMCERGSGGNAEFKCADIGTEAEGETEGEAVAVTLSPVSVVKERMAGIEGCIPEPRSAGAVLVL